jgi:glutamate 5-kinase
MSNQAEIVVWKFGSDSCTNDQGVDWQRLDHYASQFAEQATQGRAGIGVISGAVAVARAMLGENYIQEEAITPQMLATRGNVPFFGAWDQALASKGLQTGELLITHHEIEDTREGKTFAGTIGDYIARGWVALINESGSTGDEETKKLAYGGDNDGLAEVVADRISADEICFMTEVDGVFDVDGKLIRVVNADNADVALRATNKGVYRGTRSKNGKGDMKSKVEAALSAAKKGRIAHIAHAESSFEDVLNGKGTLFVAH